MRELRPHDPDSPPRIGADAPGDPGQAAAGVPRPGELDGELDELGMAAQGGDAGAREELWRRARPALERLALVLGVRPDDVPDVVQEALFHADRTLGRYDASRGGFRAWIAALLATRARNHLRGASRRRRLAAAFRFERRVASSHEPARGADARLLLERLVSRLSTRQREVVALYEIAGLDAEECARVLGMTAAGVRSSARDARRKLAALLEDTP